LDWVCFGAQSAVPAAAALLCSGAARWTTAGDVDKSACGSIVLADCRDPSQRPGIKMYRQAAGLLVAIGCCVSLPASGQSPPGSADQVRIGVLTDMTAAFSDISGPGAIVAVQMAVEDFGGKVLGKPIAILSADHQNKPDIGSAIAREWFDRQGVVMVQDVMNSAVALAVMNLAVSADRVAIVNGASTSAITNDKCTPNSVHYTWDTYALAKSTGEAVVKRGGDSWFFLTVDFAYGHALAHDTGEFVKAAGGRVLGEVRHPLNAQDFSSYLVQAQSSGAKVIGLANGGADTINAVKTAGEFGITRSGRSLAALGYNLNDTAALGLQQAQGLLFTEAFYWDRTDETRAWSQRFFDRFGKMPTSTQAGDYSSTMHYLRAVEAAGTSEARAVMSKMRDLPINDFFAHDAHIRIDGRMVHDMYLAQVKSPAESKGPWDFYTILATIPGDEAFRPLAESACPLVKH
jgi:branched-chain amino acid transport system substrate-binding protein